MRDLLFIFCLSRIFFLAIVSFSSFSLPPFVEIIQFSSSAPFFFTYIYVCLYIVVSSLIQSLWRNAQSSASACLPSKPFHPQLRDASSIHSFLSSCRPAQLLGIICVAGIGAESYIRHSSCPWGTQSLGEGHMAQITNDCRWHRRKRIQVSRGGVTGFKRTRHQSGGLKKSGEVKVQNPNKQEVYAMIPLKRGREGRKEGQRERRDNTKIQ